MCVFFFLLCFFVVFLCVVVFFGGGGGGGGFNCLLWRSPSNRQLLGHRNIDRIDPSWSGPIDLFLVTASAQRLEQQRPWYVLSCLWDDPY